jgi:hypothetical protein
MHETPQDVAALQELLDRSYAVAGAHLRSIITPRRRVAADALARRLDGMCLLTVATVTGDCRPIAGPVDGVFYRGSFHFGTAPGALRRRHIEARPWVSATHLPGEEFAVTVHGRALPVDVGTPEGAGLRRTLLEIYTPRYGPQWEREFLDGSTPPLYFRIEAERMFTVQIASWRIAAAAR